MNRFHMEALRINAAEMNALAGEGAELFQLYIGAIRPWMDFKTGIVGRLYPISYMSLREATARAPRPGIRYMRHAQGKIRSMLDRLEEINVLIRVGDPQHLVFLCPLADSNWKEPHNLVKSEGHPGHGDEAMDPSRYQTD